MARYKVHFFIERQEPLATNEVNNLALSLLETLHTGKPKVTPEGRKLYIQREYTPQEERVIVKKHASANFEQGRNWNNKATGCPCDLCKEYRAFGTTIAPPEGWKARG